MGDARFINMNESRVTPMKIETPIIKSGVSIEGFLKTGLTNSRFPS